MSAQAIPPLDSSMLADSSSTSSTRTLPLRLPDFRPLDALKQALESNLPQNRMSRSLSKARFTDRLTESSYLPNDAMSNVVSEEVSSMESSIDTMREFIIPDSDNLTIVNYVNPHTTEMLQNDIKQVQEAISKFLRLVKEYSPEKNKSELNQDQRTQLQAKGEELISYTKQYLMDVQAQGEEQEFLINKKGREIPFFIGRKSNLPESAAEKICKYLNEKIVLDPTKPLANKKAQKLINPELHISQLKQIRKTSKEHKVLYTLLIYNEVLRILCAKLNEEDTILKLCRHYANEEEIDKLVEHIKKILKDNEAPESCLALVAKEISVRYIEGPFKQRILEKVAISYLQTIKDSQKYSYQNICDGFLDAFYNQTITNPAVEFERSIRGGYITFFKKDEGYLIDPYVEPKDPDKIEEAIFQFTLECQKVVGQQLFGDDTIVINFYKYLYEFANNQKLGADDETAVELQARVFNVLMSSIKSDSTNKKEFQKFMNAKLKTPIKENSRWSTSEKVQDVKEDTQNMKTMIRLENEGLDCIDIAEHLLRFFRASFQTYITEPTKILIDVYKRIFSNIDNSSIIESLAEGSDDPTNKWKDDQTKKIQIWFGKGHIKFQYLIKRSIGKQTSNPTGILIQDLRILVPLPGYAEIKNPVSLEFYYEEEDGISAEEKEKLKINLEKIAFVLKLLNFPDLKQVNKKLYTA